MNDERVMKTSDNRNWMVLAIIILAVLNITTIITVVHGRRSEKEVISVKNDKTETEQNASVNYSGRYFRDKLSLTNDQMDIFAKFNPEFRQQVRKINLELDRQRQMLLTQMAAENCDTLKLNITADSIGFLHADLKKVTYRFYLNLKSICNEEQQLKLEEIFNGIFSSDTGIGRIGRGGQQGRGRGRGSNS